LRGWMLAHCSGLRACDTREPARVGEVEREIVQGGMPGIRYGHACAHGSGPFARPRARAPHATPAQLHTSTRRSPHRSRARARARAPFPDQGSALPGCLHAAQSAGVRGRQNKDRAAARHGAAQDGGRQDPVRAQPFRRPRAPPVQRDVQQHVSARALPHAACARRRVLSCADAPAGQRARASAHTRTRATTLTASHSVSGFRIASKASMANQVLYCSWDAKKKPEVLRVT